MIIFKRKQTNPYFNIAAEEFVLEYLEEDCFSLWRNESAVILGRHQNTLAEINLLYVEENRIPVIRRMTGGGAVFHDLGNICFTFVKNRQGKGLPDFKTFTQPILEVLQGLGVNACFEGRNDLTIEGKKFSGNANRVWHNRILHHGTLLYVSNIEDMSQAIRPGAKKFEDKAVKSVRARVTNISEHLEKPLRVENFIQKVEEHVASLYPSAVYRTFTPGELHQIQQLADEKYSTWEWNYGQSPQYTFQKQIRTCAGGTMEIKWLVDAGIIRRVKVYGDYFFTRETAEFEALLEGCPHKEEEVRARLEGVDLDAFFAKVSEEEILSLLF